MSVFNAFRRPRTPPTLRAGEEIRAGTDVPRIYFNHIAKCGGTSLSETLGRGLRRDQIGIEPFVPILELYTLDGARLDRLRVIGSHFPHWAAARRLGGWTRLTALREPWQRFCALTRHLLRIAVATPSAPDAAQHRYVSLIREKRFADAIHQAQEWYPVIASMTGCLLPDPLHDGLPNGAGSIASAVLEGYDVVLLTRSLDEDVMVLDRALNGPVLVRQPRLNTSRSYGDAETGPYPPECEELFHAQYPYERELYETGVRMHDRTLARLADSSALRSTAHANDILFMLDWDGPVRCGGFSDRTLAASRGYAGRYARTVLGDIAVVEFDVPRACDCRIEAVFWIGPVEARNQCRIALNGVPVEMFGNQEVICPDEPNQVWSSVCVDRAALGTGKCRLQIDVSGVRGLDELWLLDLIVRRWNSSR